MRSLRMGRYEWLLLIGLSVLWGSSFIFIELALTSLTMFTIVTLRTGIAALALTIYLTLCGDRLPATLADWRRFLILGALRAALPISLIVWAETHITSGLASILNSTSPLFTAIIAHLLTSDDKLTGQRLAGILIGMIGVGVLVGTDALRGLGTQVLAQLAMLGATCSYGFAAVYGRQFRENSPVVSAAGMLIGATILTLPLALWEAPWTLSPTSTSIGAILGLALLSTALAFIIWFQLIFHAGPSNTAMVTFLIPFTTLILSVLVLDEWVEAVSLIGLGIILFGLAVTQRRVFRN